MQAGGERPVCAACFATIPWITRVYCAVCGRYEPCGDCVRRTDTFFVRNRSAVRYNEAMKELLARYKYRGDERLRTLLADMLSHAYRMHLMDLQATGGASPFHFITYVPLSEQRALDRGFNQAEQLAQEIGRRYGIRVVPLLNRVKHTDKQSFKTRRQRLGDLENVFALDETGRSAVQSFVSSHGMKPKILVVDDIYTTGSTLNECARTIFSGFEAEIYGLTWAR